MENKICILVCNYFTNEVQAAIESQKLDNVVVKSFASNCGKPALSKEEIKAKTDTINRTLSGAQHPARSTC